jgi:hypothetical protein
MPEEKSRRIKKAMDNIAESAKIKDATQLRGRVRIVTSSAILKLITDIVESHTGETNKELLQQITEAEFDMLKLKKNSDILRGDLERARESGFEKDSTIKELTEQLANALGTVDKRESEVRRLSEIIQTRDKEHSAKLGRLQTHLKKLKSQQEEKTNPEEIKTLREEISTLQSELRMSEDIEEMQRSEIADIEERIEKIQSENETRISGLVRKTNQLERELRTSRKLEKRLRSKLSSAVRPKTPEEKAAEDFGKTAIQLGYSAKEHIEEALKIQEGISEMGLAPPKLGDVLVDKGHLTASQANDILRAQGAGRPRIEGYEFIKKLGEGLLGGTYRAKQLSLDRDVAIKIIRPELTSDISFTEKFLKQAKQAGRLHHKNIAHIIDAGELNGIFFCISEYVRGQNLRDILLKKKKLSERQVLHIGLEAAYALGEAHQNSLVHGDMKPSNIIVNVEGIVKVCDFGLARPISLETKLVLPHKLYQAAYYISPEMVRGNATDIRSDIYSLGATLFHLLTGSYLFGKSATLKDAMLAHLKGQVPDPKEKNNQASRELADLIMRALQPKSEDRFQTPKEMVTALIGLIKKRKTAESGSHAPRRRHTRRKLK